MGSISKCKRYKEQTDKQNLQSDLFGHILSFLPTKYAVATSVLSTRWKQFWTLITSLDFEDNFLLHPGKRTKSHQTCFTNFVYRVLELRRVSCLHKLRLNGCQSYDVSHVNTWVAASWFVVFKSLTSPFKFKRVLIMFCLGTYSLVPQWWY